MSNKIKSIRAIEILDSRGYPTIEAKVVFDNNAIGICAVPSGASTGKLEACELRDNDPKRYLGKGVSKAVENVNKIIASKLVGSEFNNFKEVDEILIKLDGAENKSNLGANAILGVSLAYAKACANSNNQQFFEFLGEGKGNILPVPMMNIINGGKHADNPIDIQEFMIAPINATSIKDAIRMGAEVFHHLKDLLHHFFFHLIFFHLNFTINFISKINLILNYQPHMVIILNRRYREISKFLYHICQQFGKLDH